MSVPPSSTNSAPQSPAKHSRREKSNLFTFVFMGFMLLVGIGILVTFATGTPSNSTYTASNSSSSSRSSSKTTVSGLGFAIPATPTPEPQLKIYITGEIKSPGVYVMSGDDRITDAIAMAGGLTDQADISQLDLAQRVHDEMHITIPKLAPTPLISATLNSTVTKSTPNSVYSSSVPVVSYPNTPTVSGATQKGSNNGKIAAGSGIKINVNTADAKELQRLPGVGTTLSQRIVDYRAAHGPFHSLDDLRHIQGFTKTLVDKLQDLITF